MPRAVPKHSPNLGVRVLSLDGGGAGALSELLVLERMMYRTKTEGGLETIPSPHECFELIGGSGTGGIIALMLGRLRMSVKEAILAYDSLRPQSKIGFSEEFQASKFEEVLKNIFKNEKMEDMCRDACKTFVCAMNQMNMNAGLPVLFRSYDTPDEPANDCLIWEAARATSATPGLFKPMTIGLSGIEQQYIDSSIGNNNPTSLVLEEAKQLYPSCPAVLISSIGAGHPDTIQLPQSLSGTSIAKAFKMMATDCERTHEDTARRFRSIPNVYFRFNVQQGLQGFEAQQSEKSSEVSAHTKAYLTMADTKSRLTEVVKIILNPAVPVSESPVYLRVCPPATFRFTGRQNILQKMTEYFNRDVGRRHIFLLYGLGGAGKSQIAFKFVEISTVPQPCFSETYFIDSSTRQTIENDLATIALAKQIGKTAEDSLLWLSHQPTEWLIVFNNADDIHLNLADFFPTGFHGNILITSRNPDLRQHAQVEQKVDRMECEDSIDLLLATARYDKTAETAEIATQIVQVLCLLTENLGMLTFWSRGSIACLWLLHKLEPTSHLPVLSTSIWIYMKILPSEFNYLIKPHHSQTTNCRFIPPGK
ncbi:acyl transferase/acyl hydrolase/lysophospholipase [Mycena epipterygia]|nr:acyl transferase/acyl hydrolase/lysophospholipase [Mycena epipterygia]